MIVNDVTIDIPLNEEDGHEYDHSQYGHGQEHQQQTQNREHRNQQHDQDRTDAHSKSDSLSFFRHHGSVSNDEEGSEKTHLVPDCDASSTGRRRKSKNRRANNPHTNHMFNFNSSEDHTEPPSSANLTRLHCLYKSLINSSIIIRYLVYIMPFAILIAIPIIVGATATPYATVGGVKLYWFFAWIEVVWLSLWVCKILARGLPYVFQSLWGVLSPGNRRYALVLRTLEIPISLVGWTGVSLITFFPVRFFFVLDCGPWKVKADLADNDLQPRSKSARRHEPQVLGEISQGHPLRAVRVQSHLPHRENDDPADFDKLPPEPIRCQDKKVQTTCPAT